MTKGKVADKDGIFTRPGRPGFYISWVDQQGRRRKRRVHAHNVTQARALRQAEMERVEKAKALGFTPASEETFASAARRYLEHQRPRLTPGSYARQEGIVRLHLGLFFACKLAAIRRADVQRYVTARLTAGASADSVVKELVTLKHLLRLAVEWELIPYNPAQGLKARRPRPAGSATSSRRRSKRSSRRPSPGSGPSSRSLYSRE